MNSNALDHSKVIELRGSDFLIKSSERIQITRTNNNVPGILLIHANWCGHCVRFMPTYKKLSELLGMKFLCLSIEHSELEKNSSLNKSLNVTGFPTMKFIDEKGYIIRDYPSEKGRDLETLLEIICKYYHTCVR
jgi:thiol-disulfide isomerase/thioredoxin